MSFQYFPFCNPFIFSLLLLNIAEQYEGSAADTVHQCSSMSVPPPAPPLTCCQCVWCVFVWRCFDRLCLCVWAVLAGRWACPVQSWWRAKCSLRAGCAFHSAQPPWTPSRQTAAGGTPLSLSVSFSLAYTQRSRILFPHQLFSSLPPSSFLFYHSFPSSFYTLNLCPFFQTDFY